VKVAFDFTPDDMVDVAERAAERSSTVTGMRSQTRVVYSVIAAVVTYLILPGDEFWRLFGAGVAALLFAWIYPGDYRKLHRKKLRQYFVEQFGGEGPFRCEVELTPEGLVVVQAGARIVREWSTISAVLDGGDSIELVARGSGSLVVRNRAFKSRSEHAEFLRLARSYATSVEKK
jgi:hypothetical protein